VTAIYRLAYFLLSVSLLIFSAQTKAELTAVKLNIEQLTGDGWQLNGVQLQLDSLLSNKALLDVKIKSLQLEPPFERLKLLNLHCGLFQFAEGVVVCQQGWLKLPIKGLLTAKIPLSFTLSHQRSQLQLKPIGFIGGGLVILTATLKNQSWQIQLTANQLALEKLPEWLQNEYLSVSKAKLDANIKLKGINQQFKTLEFTLNAQKLSLQSADATIATENVHAKIQGKLTPKTWQAELTLDSGAVYNEPVYLELKKMPLKFKGNGRWQQNHYWIDNFSYNHANILQIKGDAEIVNNQLQLVNLQFNSNQLAKVSQQYLQAFFVGTGLEDLMIKGQLAGSLQWSNQQVTEIKADFSEIFIEDKAQRFRLQQAKGNINWSIAGEHQSSLYWQQLELYQLPIEKSGFDLISTADSVYLKKPLLLPLFDGNIQIEHFYWSWEAAQRDELVFYGEINQLSLDKLTQAMGWTELSGTLSGQIPRVYYRQKRLGIDSDLSIQVFGGQVVVSDFILEGLFGNFPSLQANITLDNLSLDTITHKFEVGNIQGNLSGYINELRLENWQAVSFKAWLGTPNNDKSRHRISQKAVKNIASIGGNAAADAVSRGFLGIFESFIYDKIGMGCYLNQGVCQLTGVEAAEQGYYLVKGWGIPRIDIMAYNSRVDWQVLLNRLKRITETDEVIVE